MPFLSVPFYYMPVILTCKPGSYECILHIKPVKTYFMRTCNNHPQWHNQPLRLTEEEKQNPVLVIEEFFQCYHLNDVRDILWKWMVEVISSSGSISSEALERNNHIYFYEKIEILIEAIFVLKNHFQEQLQATIAASAAAASAGSA
jgi:hypothetical protein